MKLLSNEFKIGIFVILAGAVGFVFWARTQNFTADTYTVKTYFKFVSGLKENSIVALSGYEVGKVDKIYFMYEPGTKIEVTMSISKDAKVRTDSIAYIGTAGFIGDSFVGLTAGGDNTEFVEDGAVIGSEDPIEMRELMKKAEGIATKLDETLVDVKKLMGNLNSTIQDNRPRIDSIMKNIEATSVNFNEFSTDIKQHPWKLLMKGKEKE